MNEYIEMKNIEDFEYICNLSKKIHLYLEKENEKYEIYLDTCYMNYHDLVFFCLRHKLQNDTHHLQREGRNMNIDYHKYHVLDIDNYRYFIKKKEDYIELFEMKRDIKKE